MATFSLVFRGAEIVHLGVVPFTPGSRKRTVVEEMVHMLCYLYIFLACITGLYFVGITTMMMMMTCDGQVSCFTGQRSDTDYFSLIIVRIQRSVIRYYYDHDIFSENVRFSWLLQI